MRRNVRAMFLRQIDGEMRVIQNRHYLSFRNAVRRCAEVLIMNGEPQDVVELVYSDDGELPLGGMKVHAGGKLECWWEERRKEL